MVKRYKHPVVRYIGSGRVTYNVMAIVTKIGLCIWKFLGQEIFKVLILMAKELVTVMGDDVS